MYKAFFGLKENPFNLTPDPRYLYLSPRHREALDHLLFGINERKGFITITGGIGTGKTTLCRALLGHLGGRTKTALIFNSFVSDMELLRGIHQEFGLEEGPEEETRKGYIDVLNRFLLQTFSRGENAVLLIDEAQNLSPEVLEQIRMLSNLETEREKLIQIVLVGQTELKQVLAAPHLRQLNERITVRYDLKPLDAKDVRAYLEHRLVVAGGRGNPKFSRGAIKALFRYSGGNPRRINAVCDRTLLLAYVKEKQVISGNMVNKAIKDIRGDMKTERRRPANTLIRPAFMTVLILTLIFAAGFVGFNLQDKILITFDKEPRKVVVRTDIPAAAPVEKRPRPSLFLDQKKSLAGLFTLYEPEQDHNPGNHPDQLSLFTLDLAPEYYLMLKKPFRVRTRSATQGETSPGYLLTRRITRQGAFIIDAEGKERTVDRTFLLSHWGGEVSWVYRPERKNVYLRQGMEGPEITAVQRMLREIGYHVDPHGLFDRKMGQEILQFQKDFNLIADGIVGPRTRALLYQMTGENEHD